MADTHKLSAVARDKGGKGAARAARRAGLVPAVIYGDKKPPEMINVPLRDVAKLHNTGTFMSQLLEINVDGKATRVIPRDIQLDPVRDFVIHADFLRLGKGATINVEVPVHFSNEEESPGLKAGGVLNIVRHEVELSCPAESIPETIEIDLTGLEMGASIHISHVKLQDGVTPTISDRDFTIATIAAPAAVVSEASEAEAEEGAEGAEATGEEGEAKEGEEKKDEGGDS